MKKYSLHTVRKQFKKKLFKLIINTILFKTFSLLIIFYLVFILTILSGVIGEEFKPIEFFIAFYNIFNFSWANLYLFDLDNLIRGYYVDGVYVVNPFGLILFISSIFLTSTFIYKFKYKIYRFKSHIFK